MEWSKWVSPTAVRVFEPDSIEYAELKLGNLITVQPITGVHTGYERLRALGVSALEFSDWGLRPGNISTIQLRVHVSRLARVFDNIVQLTHDNKLIGDNLALPGAEDVHVYGGTLDVWNVKQLNTTGLGVVLDYKPHPGMPSSELVYLRKIQIRVMYTISEIDAVCQSECASITNA